MAKDDKYEETIDMLIEANNYIKIIKEVLNGADINKLNEITNCMVFNWFEITIENEPVNLGFYLFGKDLVDLFKKNKNIFLTIVKLEPVIEQLFFSIRMKHYSTLSEKDSETLSAIFD